MVATRQKKYRMIFDGNIVLIDDGRCVVGLMYGRCCCEISKAVLMDII